MHTNTNRHRRQGEKNIEERNQFFGTRRKWFFFRFLSAEIVRQWGVWQSSVGVRIWIWFFLNPKPSKFNSLFLSWCQHSLSFQEATNAAGHWENILSCKAFSKICIIVLHWMQYQTVLPYQQGSRREDQGGHDHLPWLRKRSCRGAQFTCWGGNIFVLINI